MTDRERGQAGYIAAAFHLLVRTVAAVLHDAGAPLDHESAAEIQPPGVSAFDPGGRSPY